MSIRPWVIVEPPDSRGLRRVTIGGETVGSAWSPAELRRILGRRGYPEDLDLDDPASVCWRGGDSGTWTDRAWKRRLILSLMVAGPLVSMVFNAVIGWPDASGALTFAQRITGLLFVLSGVVLGIAAIAALDHWGRRQFKASGAIVLLGAIIVLATDGLLLLLWFEEREYTRSMLVYVPAFCWSLWALCLLVHQKSWKGLPQPKKFAAGVVATVLLTAVSLAYSTMYQPAAAPMHFTLKAEFGKAWKDDNVDFVHVPLTLYMKNTGGIPVYIINDVYTVRGRTAVYSYAEEDVVTEWEKSFGRPGMSDGEAELYVGRLEYTTISAGRFYDSGNSLDVGQEYTMKRVFQVPRALRYDTVSVELKISYMRRDRGRVDVEEFRSPHRSWKETEGTYYCEPAACGEQLVYRGRVRHNNNLINVTRKPRYVTAVWSPTGRFVSSISSFPFNYYGVGDYGEQRRELERYGAATARADSEIPAAELLRSAGV
ncbi:Yip1 family protein [Streptomyces sp. NPDC057052]|uniref:Yip1 family protein n=1 Tax=Streptomyces sp. NPDC057052 TaxID=3346010 RepID=UPI00363470CB